MSKFVNRPVIKNLVYCPHNADEAAPRSMALFLLRKVCRTVVPEAEQCAQAGQPGAKMPLSSGGYEEQLIKFRRKANMVYEELGPWATDFFILESIKTLSESFSGGSRFLYSRTTRRQSCFERCQRDTKETRPKIQCPPSAYLDREKSIAF